MEIVPGSEWETLFEELKRRKGTAIIIGANDSGKSTLARYLIKKLVSETLRVCLIDSDVGQSSIGLPGTISMKVFTDIDDLEDFRFGKMVFVGSANPAKKIPQIIDGTKKIYGICGKISDVTLIDTSGLVSGDLGKALKISKIKTIEPEHIIALQREDELGHILSLIKDIPIHSLKVSRMAKARSREARARYRAKKIHDYFNEAKLYDFLLSTKKEKFIYNGKPFRPQHGDFAKGILIGLNHDGDTMALGIVSEVTGEYITFRSPIKSLKPINEIVLGEIKI